MTSDENTPFLKAIEDLASSGAQLVGLVVEHDGYEMQLSPGDDDDGAAWRATSSVESFDGEPETAIGEGATPLEALNDCSQMAERIEAGEDEEGSDDE